MKVTLDTIVDCPAGSDLIGMTYYHATKTWVTGMRVEDSLPWKGKRLLVRV